MPLCLRHWWRASPQFEQHRVGLQTVSARTNKSELCGPDWFGQPSDASTFDTWALRRVTESIKHWGDELQIAHSRGVGACPATTLIDDPQILSDKQLQDQLFKNPQRSALSKLYKELSTLLWFLKKASDSQVPITEHLKTCIGESVKLKRRMKCAIAVDWLLDQILNNMPEETADIREWARELGRKLLSKSAKVPDFNHALLNQLHRGSATEN